MPSIESEVLAERMREAVSLCWGIFSKKVGNRLLQINKEASMQLQYAYLLKQLVPIITLNINEVFEIELETGVKLSNGTREVDLMFTGISNEKIHKIAIEMKCYKTLASSGKPRGATDIFMKDVYFDFYLLEQYIKEKKANEGVALVMNDLRRLVYPSKKEAKCWDYDTSHNTQFDSKILNTPIGGKLQNFELELSYLINWKEYGNYWFLEIQGK